MKKEDELYIELYLSKIIELSIEASYSVDKLGNLIFKDKNKVKQEINKIILEAMQEIDASEEEIRDYLINMYKNKCTNQNFVREGTELISILEESKGDREKNKENQINEKEIS